MTTLGIFLLFLMMVAGVVGLVDLLIMGVLWWIDRK